MQIVIELSESDFEDIKKHSGSYSFGEAIKNGVVLPRGHGRLIDADAVKNIAWFSYTRGYAAATIAIVNSTPTVIEADVTDINVGKMEEE